MWIFLCADLCASRAFPDPANPHSRMTRCTKHWLRDCMDQRQRRASTRHCLVWSIWIRPYLWTSRPWAKPLVARWKDSKETPGKQKALLVLDYLDKAVLVAQSPMVELLDPIPQPT